MSSDSLPFVLDLSPLCSDGSITTNDMWVTVTLVQSAAYYARQALQGDDQMK